MSGYGRKLIHPCAMASVFWQLNSLTFISDCSVFCARLELFWFSLKGVPGFLKALYLWIICY